MEINCQKTEITPYIHNVKYYETDKMGIVHHSNYIRFMEEARIFFLDEIGYSYINLEKENITSPTVDIKCTYKKPTYFNDNISIYVRVKSYNGVRITFAYIMKVKDNIVATGESTHCFLNPDHSVVILRKKYPDFDKALNEIKEN